VNRLPRGVRLVLAHTVPRELGEFVLGDLTEEFHARCSRSRAGARRWLWRQVLASAPRFLWQRFAAGRGRALATLLVVTAAGYGAMHLWDVYVARELARSVAAQNAGAPLVAIRVLYICLQGVAFAIAGAALAHATFRRDQSFVRNAALRLAPIAAAQFIPPFAASLTSADGYPMLFLIPWLLISAAALAGGAYVIDHGRRGGPDRNGPNR